MVKRAMDIGGFLHLSEDDPRANNDARGYIPAERTTNETSAWSPCTIGGMTRHGCQLDLMSHSFCKIRLTQFTDTWSPASPNFHLYRGIHDDTLVEFSSGSSAIFGVSTRRCRTDAIPTARTSCGCSAGLRRRQRSNDHPHRHATRLKRNRHKKPRPPRSTCLWWSITARGAHRLSRRTSITHRRGGCAVAGVGALGDRYEARTIGSDRVPSRTLSAAPPMIPGVI
jgi:hypothetical protein